ncbi:Oxysterol binding protein-like protein OBPa [Scheffersomyces stipitis CBS 6054]|uniref:Oxysterol binding protein-like protein OBPa n=1 Tax=Scheffersomyces stipitis (strain ATCC 58785 / CBS 6054 / NBRC 10063 / NRRL Y-11545) TaxID=322104 RepID=A3LZ99_PICST|nr:Oxysterol binding protein-like protein OBPa [Scheffersomyces stipitis CBS 6054]ABN68302.2 Oxysterol binding protein-like protein OBPa [Scheffersomyces stipitis CBS 6054]
MGLTSKLDKLKLISSGGGDEPVGKSSQSGPENTDDIDEVDNEGQSILMGIIAQLRPGMDLSKITLPTFILEKKSMLERITNFFQIPQILLEANATTDDLERFVLIVKWYLASWHIAPKAVKKPLNPVLGETFACYWDDLPGNESAFYLSEQTSHHPPKSSYFYLVPEQKIRVDGVVIPKSRFLGNSSAAIMEGWGHVTLGNHDDELYIMNQPNVYVRGILFGKMKTELGDHMYIKCPKTGYEADIEFKTKGFISGTYDAIEGVIKNTKKSETLFEISGKWNEVMEIKNIKTNKKEVFYDTKKTVTHRPKVRPLEEQWDYESRKLWKPTIDALSRRDHETATEEKYKVENEQRTLAKKRIEDGVEFHPKFFRPVKDSETDQLDLEYLIYKKFDLKDDSETLKKHLFEISPFLPGQVADEKYHIPAFKKHKE